MPAESHSVPILNLLITVLSECCKKSSSWWDRFLTRVCVDLVNFSEPVSSWEAAIPMSAEAHFVPFVIPSLMCNFQIFMLIKITVI